MVNTSLRNQKIDLLRGIAIFLVMILHYHIAYHLDQSVLNKLFSRDFITAFARNGNYGVTMFFVVSGFLITTTSFERYGSLSKIDIRQFYFFRFARIMPCLLLALSIIILFNVLHISIFENKPHTTSLVIAILSVLTFWHNVLMSFVGYFNYCLNILWSLSVEEVFYLTFPLFCLLLKKTRVIMISLALLIIIAPFYRSFYTNNEIVALYGYLSCFDAIALGCCAAIVARHIKLYSWFGKLLQYSAILLMITVYFYAGIMDIIVMGVSLIAFGTAILLIGAHTLSTSAQLYTRGRVERIICWFGRHSYELYLFHIILLALMKTIYPSGGVG